MTETRFVNLTPHTVNVAGVEPLAPSGTVARCLVANRHAGYAGNVTLVRATYGAVEGLPEPTPGVVYVVSGLVRAAVPERTDVASPGDLLRDSDGNVVGCLNLVIN